MTFGFSNRVNREASDVTKLEFQAPKARNAKAQGNALGERLHLSLRALKARNRDSLAETKRTKPASPSLRAFSARKPSWLVPGPMAQAIAFRAFGAERLSLEVLQLGKGAAARFISGLIHRWPQPDAKALDGKHAEASFCVAVTRYPALKALV